MRETTTVKQTHLNKKYNAKKIFIVHQSREKKNQTMKWQNNSKTKKNESVINDLIKNRWVTQIDFGVFFT